MNFVGLWYIILSVCVVRLFLLPLVKYVSCVRLIIIALKSNFDVGPSRKVSEIKLNLYSILS